MPLPMECCRPTYDYDLGTLKLVMRNDNDTNVVSKCHDGRNRVDDVHGKLSLLDPGQGESSNMGLYDRPLPCFGCGVGWFSFVAGFICPPFWYYATVLYFGGYYHHHRDPRERAGLAASAIAAFISTVIIMVSLLAVLVPHTSRSQYPIRFTLRISVDDRSTLCTTTRTEVC